VIDLVEKRFEIEIDDGQEWAGGFAPKLSYWFCGLTGGGDPA
jgi:hypothetical protein